MTNPVRVQFFGGDEEDGNVFIVETLAKAGHQLGSHGHQHAHSSVLVSGTADVTIGEMTTRLTGYSRITVPANVVHKVEAVTDIIWLCLWDSAIAPRDEAIEYMTMVADL